MYIYIYVMFFSTPPQPTPADVRERTRVCAPSAVRARLFKYSAYAASSSDAATPPGHRLSPRRTRAFAITLVRHHRLRVTPSEAATALSPASSAVGISARVCVCIYNIHIHIYTLLHSFPSL